MSRKITPCHETLDLVWVETIRDLRTFLLEQSDGNPCWLLAHADDGVIWGYLADGQVITARDATFGTPEQTQVEQIVPELRLKTLQSVRLFAPDFEIMLWRADTSGWYRRLIFESQTDATYHEAIDETHMLWGDDMQTLSGGFTLMVDGAQGLKHIVPLSVIRQGDGIRPLRLCVRQFIQTDDTGFTRIVASRLAGLQVEDANAR